MGIPWLQSSVTGDVEKIDTSAIHAYAGHGTFVTGVAKCLAPASTIEVEGFLTKGGAIYESDITKQLNQAMTDREQPHIISISAGGRTRLGSSRRSFPLNAAPPPAPLPGRTAS